MQLISRSSKQETMKVLPSCNLVPGFRREPWERGWPSCWIKEMSRGHVSTNQAFFASRGPWALVAKNEATFPEYAHLPPVELTLPVRPQSALSTSAGSLAKV